MKQDIAIYLTDSFTDYAGKEHKFVACALSQTPDDPEFSLEVGWIDQNGVIDTDSELYQKVNRMVTIGIAICNPTDTFDEEAGQRIAYNKAAHMENLPRLYAPAKGLITRELVETFLHQQVKFFKENPETLIPGYLQAKKKFEACIEAERAIDTLTDAEKTVLNHIVNGVDIDKCLKLVKPYSKRIANHEQK